MEWSPSSFILFMRNGRGKSHHRVWGLKRNRCSSDLRLNVHLTLHLMEMGVCLSFILPFIYQCQNVNYLFIYLFTTVRTEYKFTPLPLKERKPLLGEWYLPLLNERVTCCFILEVFCSTNHSSVLMSMRLDHILQGTAYNYFFHHKPLFVVPLRARHQAWSLINDRKMEGINLN